MGITRVRIIIEGHQLYREVEGELLHVGSTAERFDNTWLQVPCMIVRSDDGEVHVVSLKSPHIWTRVTASTIQPAALAQPGNSVPVSR